MGDAQERALSTSVVSATRKEAAFPSTAPQLPSIPHHGDQPQIARQSLARLACRGL